MLDKWLRVAGKPSLASCYCTRTRAACKMRQPTADSLPTFAGILQNSFCTEVCLFAIEHLQAVLLRFNLLGVYLDSCWGFSSAVYTTMALLTVSMQVLCPPNCRRAILTEQPDFKGRAWSKITEPAIDFVRSLLVK